LTYKKLPIYINILLILSKTIRTFGGLGLEPLQSKMIQQIPKVSQQIPKVSQQIPKVSQQIPKVSQQIPKVSQQIPKGLDCNIMINKAKNAPKTTKTTKTIKTTTTRTRKLNT